MPSGKIRLKDSTIADIRAEYQRTKDVRKTAKMFGLSETTIRCMVKRKGAYKDG